MNWKPIESFTSIANYRKFEISLYSSILSKECLIVWWKSNDTAIPSAWPIDGLAFYRVQQNEYWFLQKPNPPATGYFTRIKNTFPWIDGIETW